MAEEMLTLPKFEEASEIVKKVTQETKLVYSKYFSEQTGNKVYLKPENMQLTAADDTDRFRRLCHSRLTCRIKVLPPVRRRSVSHGTLRAGQPAPHPAVRGSTRLSAPRSSPR